MKSCITIFVLITLLFIISSCANSDTHVHQPSNWIINDYPSCTKDGTMIGTCECGKKIADIIPATGHNFVDGVCQSCDKTEGADACTHSNIVYIEGKEASCTESGTTRGEKCADCNAILKAQEVILKLEHITDAPEKSIITQPSCTTPGTYEMITRCKRCNEIITKSDKTEFTSIVYELNQGHCFAGDICKWCGANIPESSAGLVFQPNDDGKSYTLIDAKNCTDRNIVISTYNGLPVTKIATGAFGQGIVCNSISLGDSVKTIEDGAFNLSFTNFLNIGKSLEFNNNIAFATLIAQKINISDENPNLKMEGESLLTRDGKSLIKVAWFGFDMFYSYGWDIIVDYNYWSYFEMLGDIDYDSIINSCYIPEGFVIPEGDYKESLNVQSKTYTTPKTVERIEAGVFIYSYYKEVVIRDNVTSLGESPFLVSGVRSIIIGDGITEIPESFVALSLTKSITIGRNVKSIHSNAFLGNITEVINKSDIDLSNYTWLSSPPMIIHSENESRITETDDGFIFIRLNNKTYLIDYIGGNNHIILPDYCNGESYELYFNAIRGDQILSIVIPDTITSIPAEAITYCDNLVSITIGKNVEYIHIDNFDKSNNIIEVVDNSKNKVAESLIYGSEYSELRNAPLVHTGESIIEIVDDTYVFATFNGVNYLYCVLNTEELVLPESYKGEMYEISAYFRYSGSTESLIIPDGVSAIGTNAFQNNTTLLSVTIGKNVKRIDNDAFYGCRNIIEIVNNSDLDIIVGSTSHGSIAYYALEVKSGESTLEHLGDYLVAKCGGLYYIVKYRGDGGNILLPNNIKGEMYAIYNEAFYFCNLTSVTITDGVIGIGYRAFAWNTDLTGVTIGKNVEYIDETAFEWCVNLTTIINNSKVEVKTPSYIQLN